MKIVKLEVAVCCVEGVGAVCCVEGVVVGIQQME